MSHTLRIEVSTNHNPDATPDADGQYPVAFIRKQLKSSEVYPDDQRYDAGTGQIQTTNDGGVTWVNAPQLDPRRTPFGPPPVGANINCDGAASVTAYIRRFFDQTLGILIAGGTVASAVAATMAALIELGPFAILIAVLTAAIDAFAIAGANVIKAQLTDAVYETLMCIIACRIGPDGVCSASELATIKSDVTTLIGGAAASAINVVLTLLGEGGVSTAAGRGYATGDCSGCGACEWCYTFDFKAAAHTEWWSPGGFETYGADNLNRIMGTWLSGVGWRWTDYPTTATYKDRAVSISCNWGVARTITQVAVTFSRTGNNGNWPNAIWDAANTPLVSNTAQGTNLTLTWNGSRSTTHIGAQVWPFGQTNVTPTGYADISSITIRGQGECPFGPSNC